ncbi:down syndrome cell adhesion molecule-like protein Dscam2 [Caerostris extrusa]|uniref:Down syndrome cell adhesion molecule-like protein Dscam2 n=1 Tax=Caerostris extrusa TaxID=172846 RepID=A0AAV4Y6A7_CAEEX|nr:down syndrome cell adhesion molecule-like protein Dscam2 [Caerostris extrusa]
MPHIVYDVVNELHRYQCPLITCNSSKAIHAWEEPWTLAKTTVVDSSDSMFTLQGLVPHTSYHIRVKAENAVGSGDFSEPITVVTDGEAPSGPPREVRAIATSSRTIQVTWKESLSPIDGYYVGYKSRNSDQFAYKTLETSLGGLLECEITDLNKKHKVQSDRASLQQQRGRPTFRRSSSANSRVWYDPPSAPILRLVSATASSIHLTWELSSENANPVAGQCKFPIYVGLTK